MSCFCAPRLLLLASRDWIGAVIAAKPTERRLMLERQREGINAAKVAGK